MVYENTPPYTIPIFSPNFISSYIGFGNFFKCIEVVYIDKSTYQNSK